MLCDEHEVGDDGACNAPWLASFGEIVSSGQGQRPSGGSAMNEAIGQSRFFKFLGPFVETGRSRLRKALVPYQRGQGDSPLRLSHAVESALIKDLTDTLDFIVARTLVLELNVARTLDQLVGATPEERLTHFLTHRLADSKIQEDLLHEYPVLTRIMTSAVERWLVPVLELLHRLANDLPSIEACFGGDSKLGELAAIRPGLSDPHRGGRTVALLEFESALRIVYKPKPLAVDVEFQKLLTWFNNIGLQCEQRILKVLNRGEYGWVEFAHHSSCESVEELRGFYLRQGNILALLYLLKATDIHFENLVAAGEYPVLVDLETIFHHRPPAVGEPSVRERLLTALKESVFSIGLLPVFALERGRASGVDYSALGGRRGQKIPHPVPALEDVDRDTMRFVQAPATTTDASNRPKLHGEPVNAAPYGEQIIAGFVEAYRKLAHERSALAERLEAFADVEVRHVLRPTFHYTFLLNSALHPDFLRDGMGREQVFNRLWSGMNAQPILRQVIRFEHTDLLAGDVPIFTTRPGSRDLWSSHGDRLPDFFPQTSLDACKQRLHSMSERDCTEQLGLLRMSLQSLE